MRSPLVLLSSLAFVMSQPSTALACACCADPGYRVEGSLTLDVVKKQELERVRFAKTVSVYEGPGEDPIKGISPGSNEYSLSSASKGSVLLWKLKGDGGSGTLTLTLPSKIERFYADLHDTPPNRETVLYKEWRLAAKLTGTGVFKAGIVKGTKATLILQGRGNHCDDAEMFTHWTLIVKGPKADYILYGALDKPSP